MHEHAIGHDFVCDVLRSGFCGEECVAGDDDLGRVLEIADDDGVTVLRLLDGEGPRQIASDECSGAI